MEAYKKLENVFEKAYRFQHFLDLADWDAAVMMPSCGAEARGEAMAVLKNHIHHMYSSPEVQAMIAEAATAEGEMSDIERANFREMQRIVQEETMFTDEFVKRKAKVLNMSQRVWAKARPRTTSRRSCHTSSRWLRSAVRRAVFALATPA